VELSPNGLGRVAVLSPHCDDAVFACGELLSLSPDAVVITVCAGGPTERGSVTSWDAAAGFTAGDDVMVVRRREDAQALSLLHATPVWLEFRDTQYRHTPGDHPSAAAVADAVEGVVRRYEIETVLFPAGLFHDDHRLTHEAALLLRARHPAHCWLIYADALYRCIPGLLEARVKALHDLGLTPQPVSCHADHRAAEVKQQAVQCYRSQLRALSTPGRLGHADALAEERYWMLQDRGS
jgi:LmbE family N-acetylglucosaminyl deacetylase